jgi:hypothetical protein
MKILILFFLAYSAFACDVVTFKGKFGNGRYITFPDNKRYDWDWEKRFYYKGPGAPAWLECNEIDWYLNGLKINCNYDLGWIFKIVLKKDCFDSLALVK